MKFLSQFTGKVPESLRPGRSSEKIPVPDHAELRMGNEMNRVEETACARLSRSGGTALEVLPQLADPVMCAADVAATFLRDAAVLAREYARQTTPRILATHDFGFAWQRPGEPAYSGAGLSGEAMSVDALTSLLS